MTDYQQLLEAVERDLHRSFTAPSDFKWLSQEIAMRTRENLSAMTLMRLWGYVPGGTPRKVTLDIVARGIGYMGFDDFMKASSISSQEGEKQPKGQRQLGKSREEGGRDGNAVQRPFKEVESEGSGSPILGRKRGRLFVAVAACVVGVLLWKWLATQPSKPVFVTDLGQLSNTKQYYIHTLGKRRGSLGVCDRMLATDFIRAKRGSCVHPTPFAILQHEGKYYLYSTSDRSFVNIMGAETDAPAANGWSAISITPKDSSFVVDYKNEGYCMTLNMNEESGVIITDYGTQNGLFDAGNMLSFEEAGDFDPTEALAMLKEPNPEFEAANETIEAEGRYAIYTLYPEGDEARCYYLKADGRLTAEYTDSCIFTFHRTGNFAEPYSYRIPAWRICSHTAKGGEQGFTSRVVFNRQQAFPEGHLAVDTLRSGEWQSQVLFLNAEGFYAVRATNMNGCHMMASQYWAVYDLNSDGQPEADYGEERAYVWQLKKL